MFFSFFYKKGAVVYNTPDSKALLTYIGVVKEKENRLNVIYNH